MTTEYSYALFDTALGVCGVAWTQQGVAGVQLPEVNADLTRSRMLRRFPVAVESRPAAEGQRTVDGIVALLRGEAANLGDVALDLHRVPAFDRRVYHAARSIAPGMTLTYGELAARLGDSGLARAVGQALARNPFAIVVPCHRVLAAAGKPGGFSASGGVATKLTLLAIEGARTQATPDLFNVEDTSRQAYRPLT